MSTRITLKLSPTELMGIFHAPEVVVYCGETDNIEAAACHAFLHWKSQYPDYLPTLLVEGHPAEQRAINRALFRSAS